MKSKTHMLIKQRNRLFELKIPKSLKLVYVWRKGLGLFANKSFKRGRTVLTFHTNTKRVLCAQATPEAVQINNRDCLDTTWLVPESIINHGCFPNTQLDIEGFRYIAIRDIRRNE